MKEDRFKFGVCHVRTKGSKVITGKSVNPGVYYEGYPTRERLEKEVVPELVAMAERGRQGIAFPLGIYAYAYHGKLAFPRNRRYVQQVPERPLDLLGQKKKAVYFIDEEHNLHEVGKDSSIRRI